MTKSSSSFAAAASRRENIDSALAELLQKLDSSRIDPRLLLIFSAGHSLANSPVLSREIQSRYPSAIVAGCGCQGTIFETSEVEDAASIAVWAAEIPDLDIQAFHLQFQRTPDGNAFAGTGTAIELADWDPTQSVLLALADPFTFPMDVYLELLREEAPCLPVVGGMASNGHAPGTSQLILNDQVVNHGAVIVGLRTRKSSGARRFATVVSQGCRPIGEPLIVTAAERNRITGLGGQPALRQLLQVMRKLPTSEQRMLQQGLQLGVAVDEYRDKFGFGDFLIRNVTGVDQEQEAVLLGDFVRVGQTVQFHLRDHLSATADLKKRVQSLLAEVQPRRPKAGLVFSCNGRGTNLFPIPNHDADLICKLAGEIPLAGFFAAGEIGPVSGVNFVHGFTASCLFVTE